MMSERPLAAAITGLVCGVAIGAVLGLSGANSKARSSYEEGKQVGWADLCVQMNGEVVATGECRIGETK